MAIIEGVLWSYVKAELNGLGGLESGKIKLFKFSSKTNQGQYFGRDI